MNNTITLNEFAGSIPEDVFLFGFAKNTPVRESFRHGDYTCRHLKLFCFPKKVTTRLWEDVIESSDAESGFYVRYVDDDMNDYYLLADAIFREERLKDGSLPFAMVSKDKVYYAGDNPMLFLPDCF